MVECNTELKVIKLPRAGRREMFKSAMQEEEKRFQGELEFISAAQDCLSSEAEERGVDFEEVEIERIREARLEHRKRKRDILDDLTFGRSIRW
jgi:hypothetical protein